MCVIVIILLHVCVTDSSGLAGQLQEAMKLVITCRYSVKIELLYVYKLDVLLQSDY